MKGPNLKAMLIFFGVCGVKINMPYLCNKGGWERVFMHLQSLHTAESNLIGSDATLLLKRGEREGSLLLRMSSPMREAKTSL